MKETLYHLRSRKKQIFSNIIIVTLVMLASFMVFLLPQLINPQILGQYFDNYNQGSISLEQHVTDVGILYFENDIEFYGFANSVEFLEDFSSILETTSLDVFGIFNTISYDLHCYENILFNGTDNNILFGISREKYEEILTINQNITSYNEAIVITSIINDSISNGFYTIQIADSNALMKIDSIITLNETLTALPYFLSFIDKKHHIDEGERIFFMPEDTLMQRYHNIITESSSYTLEGYIVFAEEQKNVVYWSRGAKDNLNDFYEQLLNSLRNTELSVSLNFDLNAVDKVEQDALAVEIIYTFVRGIQILCWFLSLVILIISINKTQRIKHEQELRILMSGYSNVKRIVMHFSESFILIFISLAICSAALFPLIKFQVVFGISLEFNHKLMVDLSYFVILMFVIIFGTFLEYDLFVRKKIFSSSKDKEYKPLVLFSTSSKIIVILLAGILFWLVNIKYRSEYILLTFVGSIIVSLILVVLLRGIVLIISKITTKWKEKNNTPKKDISILFRLWRKNFFSKIYLFTFILSILISVLLLTNLTADYFRTVGVWTLGSEITFDVSKNNTTEIEDYLLHNSNVISYTKIVYVGANLFTSFTGNYNSFFGINCTEYWNFYGSWNKKDWILDDDIDNFDNSSLYATKKLKEYDIEIGGTLILTTGRPMQVKDFINKWPKLTSPDGDSSLLTEGFIIDLELLEQVLAARHIDYVYRYLVHTSFEKTESIAKELESREETDELSYVNIKFHEGAKIVIFNIVIITFQIFVFLWSSLFVYSGLEEVNLSNRTRGLGLLAVSRNYKKTLQKYKFVEFLILILMFLTLATFLVFIIYQVYLLLFGIKIMISFQTIRNLAIILGIYPIFLIFQAIAENLKYNRLDLSLLYRHPE